jgi:hypothetical protein
MTCEIAVINREAVALAADSASSIGYGRKVFPSAQKLFSLSPNHPVGIMVYGDADMLEVPWETVVKRYRDQLGTQTFPTLGEYGENLIAFLERNEHDLLPDIAQRRYFSHTVRNCFQALVHDIDDFVRMLIEEKGSITHRDVAKLASFLVDKYLDTLTKGSTFGSIPGDYSVKLLEKYEQEIDAIRREVFEELPLSRVAEQQLKDICLNLFLRDIHSVKSSKLEYFSEYEPRRLSGIVIAGFGDHDTFPSIVTYEIEGMLLNHLIYTPSKEKSKTIDLEELPAEIIPFAQTDMVEQFLYGVDQDYDLELINSSRDEFRKACHQIIDGDKKLGAQDKQRLETKLRKRLESAAKTCIDKSLQFQLDKHWWPMLRVLSALPKTELATVARLSCREGNQMEQGATTMRLQEEVFPQTLPTIAYPGSPDPPPIRPSFPLASCQ